MKKRFFSFLTIKKYHAVFSSVALLFILCSGISSAQPVIVPAGAIDVAVTPVGLLGYPNSASIDYTPNNGGLGGPHPQLTAVVIGVDPNGAAPAGGPQLWVNDQVAGWTSIAIPAPITPTSATDVIVGNDLAFPNRYLIGLVYNAGGAIFLQLFTVNGTGSGILTLGLGGGPIIISGANPTIGAPHIDIIGEYSTPFPGPGGLPRANSFVVTWEQPMQGIWAYSASLNAPFPGTVASINPNNLAHMPDVAAVERRNPFTGLNEHWALFTYQQQISAIDLVDYYVVYQEWDLSNNAVGVSKVYDIKPLVPNQLLRIDAIDDYNFNNPGPNVYPLAPSAANAYFCIAATANTGGVTANAPSTILAYNNIAGAWNPIDVSTPPGLVGQLNVSPVVACGPGPNYTVGYYSPTFGSIYAPYFATSINWSTGVQNIFGNAYDIPLLNNIPSTIPGGIALASTCNTDASGVQAVFPCWQNQNRMWGKYTNNVVYSFKENPALGVAGLSSQDYAVMPNPASDYIILEGPEHTANQYRYQITDITGRAMLQASITNEKERVDIRDLASGMYILNIYNNDQNIKTFKLLKQ